MTNIHGEYVTPHIICVRGKLDKNLTSLLNTFGCSVDQCDLIGVWMLYLSYPQGGD